MSTPFFRRDDLTIWQEDGRLKRGGLFYCAKNYGGCMPAYNNVLPPSAIWPGDFAQVWNAEQPAAGNGGASASQRVALGAKEGGPGGFSVTGFFSGAPGSFEIDVQVSDVDNDTQYQTCANGNITSVDTTNQSFHFDGSTVLATFVRLLMRSRTNAVNITADIRRL